MAHYRILMTYKDSEDPDDIIYENRTCETEEDYLEPFGFDWMCPLTKPSKVSTLSKELEYISGIIKSGEILYQSPDIGALGRKDDAILKLNPEDNYIIYDIHL